MSDPVVTDEAVEAALGALQSPEDQDWADAQEVAERGMRRALTAAMPHLVSERDAEIARLHSIIREMVRLSPDNPEVEDAALASLEKPHE